MQRESTAVDETVDNNSGSGITVLEPKVIVSEPSESAPSDPQAPVRR